MMSAHATQGGRNYLLSLPFLSFGSFFLSLKRVNLESSDVVHAYVVKVAISLKGYKDVDITVH